MHAERQLIAVGRRALRVFFSDDAEGPDMQHPLENIAAQQPPFDPADAPVEAVLGRGGRELRMSFADGSTAAAPAETLRLRCRCAWCTRARVDGRFPAAFAGAAIVLVEPMGGYAVHLVFADGHDRGIFPWSYLRSLAREASAAAARPEPAQAA